MSKHDGSHSRSLARIFPIVILLMGFCTTLRSATDVNPALALNIRGVVNVLDSGAKGNGTTDDSKAIQAAIDSVAASPTGGMVLFPAGTYLITNTIYIRYTVCKGITLCGLGSRQSLLSYTGEKELFRVEAKDKTNAGFIDTITFCELGFKGNESKKPTTAIWMKQIESPFLISNCRFEHFGDYAVVLDAFAMEGVVSGCTFNSNTKGLLLNGYNDRVSVENTSFWNHQEALRICSSRVKVHNCFFGKARVAVVFQSGPLQLGGSSVLSDCDFEGQQDMKCFVEVGEQGSASREYQDIKIKECTFGVNRVPRKEGLAGNAAIQGEQNQLFNVPVGILLHAPVRTMAVSGCKFVNIGNFVIDSTDPAAKNAKPAGNSYENNRTEHVFGNKILPFSAAAEPLFLAK